jgi:hypothetical protein
MSVNAKVIMALAVLLSAVGAPAQQPERTVNTTAPALKIIRNSLHDRESGYVVNGTIYNPNAKAVKNVVIKYYIWKKYMATEDSKRNQDEAEETKAKLKIEIAAYREQIDAIRAEPGVNTAPAANTQAAAEIVALQRKIVDAVLRYPRPAQTGGLVTANINYIPPKQSVAFTATGCCADVMTHEMPDPLSAEITAEWNQ